MEVAIRLATLGDVEQLVSLRRAFAFEDDVGVERPEFAEECRAFLHAAISSGRWRIWVASLGAEIVAQLFVGLVDKVPRPTEDRRRIAYLTNVYTVPAHRNRGIGENLLAAAQEDAVSLDVELMFVWPSDESLDFYRRAGFASGRDPLVWEP